MFLPVIGVLQIRDDDDDDDAVADRSQSKPVISISAVTEIISTKFHRKRNRKLQSTSRVTDVPFA